MSHPLTIVDVVSMDLCFDFLQYVIHPIDPIHQLYSVIKYLNLPFTSNYCCIHLYLF